MIRSFALALALLALGAAAAAQDGMVTKPSRFSVAQTLDRLERIVTEKGFTVFARVDHAAGAAAAGLSLRPAELLIFGNPKVGTALMDARPSAALDLPIRVAAWEDSAGQVWLGYDAPAWLAGRHRIAGVDAVVEKMTGALRALTDAAVEASQ